MGLPCITSKVIPLSLLPIMLEAGDGTSVCTQGVLAVTMDGVPYPEGGISDVRNGECVRDLLTDLSGVWQVKFNDRRCVAAVQRPVRPGDDLLPIMLEAGDGTSVCTQGVLAVTMDGECVRDLLTDLSGVWQVKFNDRRCVAAVQRDNMTGSR
jgi:hypothetical protein